MTSQLAATAAMLSLCLSSAAPGLAQSNRFAGFDGPRGANATVNLRVPLGARRGARRATLGFTAGYGRPMGIPEADSPPAVRQVPIADLQFDRGGLDRARLAGFELVGSRHDLRLDQSDDEVDEIEEEETKKGYLYYAIIGTLVAGLIGALALTRDEQSNRDAEPATPSTPTGG